MLISELFCNLGIITPSGDYNLIVPAFQVDEKEDELAKLEHFVVDKSYFEKFVDVSSY